MQRHAVLPTRCAEQLWQNTKHLNITAAGTQTADLQHHSLYVTHARALTDTRVWCVIQESSPITSHWSAIRYTRCQSQRPWFPANIENISESAHNKQKKQSDRGTRNVRCASSPRVVLKRKRGGRRRSNKEVRNKRNGRRKDFFAEPDWAHKILNAVWRVPALRFWGSGRAGAVVQ